MLLTGPDKKIISPLDGEAITVEEYRELMLAKAEEYGCPEGVARSLTRYALEGGRVGHFLTAVLKNDLVAACKYADLENGRHLREIVMLAFNLLPGTSWGSEKMVKNWEGLLNKEDK